MGQKILTVGRHQGPNCPKCGVKRRVEYIEDVRNSGLTITRVLTKVQGWVNEGLFEVLPRDVLYVRCGNGCGYETIELTVDDLGTPPLFEVKEDGTVTSLTDQRRSDA